MLSIESLSINYPDKELPALKDINFELPKGAVCLLSGDSGSGQTTLCLAIAGVLQHTRPEAAVFGSIRWNDRIIKHEIFHPEVAITLENPYCQLSGIKRSVREELAFGLEMQGFPSHKMEERIHLASDKFGISHLLPRNPKTLSGGETQKVVIASSYLLMPQLWILDRPLTELDPLARFEFLQTLKELANQNGTTVIITEEPASDIYSIATHLLTITNECVIFSLNMAKDLVKSVNTSIFTTMSFTKTGSNFNRASSAINSSVQVTEVGFQYAPDQPMIFENLNIFVEPGECLWITGPNGCGKTTLAKIIAGILKHQRGEVKVNGINVGIEPLWKVARCVAYAFQNPDLQIFSINIWEEVSFGPKVLGYSEEKCNELTGYTINLFGLGNLEKAHPHDLNRSQRKRLGLASTFATDTPILILDEPTQFQNNSERKMIKKAMDEALNKGKSILCITHATDFID